MDCRRSFLTFCCIAALAATQAAVAETITQPRTKVWVYFTDHGESNSSELNDMLARVHINERALARRTARSQIAAADVHDLSVHRDYVEALRAAGAEIKHESRYFNAVSAWVTPEQLRDISQRRFVQKVERVRTGIRKAPERQRLSRDMVSRVPGVTDDIEYGLSSRQHELINTKPLHAQGYTGTGIRVAVFDTGFFTGHSALDHLNLVAEWDFVNDDAVTTDEPGDIQGEMFHGTWSIGILAAVWPDRVMGVAWDAEYLLAKTEEAYEEVESEEDDYIAALEWADGLGADIVSSSLGYYYWYDQDDLDGDTALITRAVDIAASRGILVVTAAGNENTTAWGTIIAPADADSAVAVGAVDTTGTIQPYSSHGPTADGRIKPDVMAQGQLVATLHWQLPPSIAGASGTSAATPLVAGACALILQIHSDWSPIQVRDALRATADRANAPGNEYGWGIIDATAAANYQPTIRVTVDIHGGVAAPFNPGSQGVLPALIHGSDVLDVDMIDIESLTLAGFPALRGNVVANGDYPGLLVKFDAEAIASSVPKPGRGPQTTLLLTGRLVDGTAIEGNAVVRLVGGPGPQLSGARATTTLGDAVPNPFNPMTRIPFALAARSRVDLSVYDVRGKLVATLVDGERTAGPHSVVWDATEQASGLYFVRLRADGAERVRKIVLLK